MNKTSDFYIFYCVFFIHNKIILFLVISIFLMYCWLPIVNIYSALKNNFIFRFFDFNEQSLLIVSEIFINLSVIFFFRATRLEKYTDSTLKVIYFANFIMHLCRSNLVLKMVVISVFSVLFLKGGNISFESGMEFF